jgi:hypothetical protein
MRALAWDHLTDHGFMKLCLLYESPFVDRPRRAGRGFRISEGDDLVARLKTIHEHAGLFVHNSRAVGVVTNRDLAQYLIPIPSWLRSRGQNRTVRADHRPVPWGHF